MRWIIPKNNDLVGCSKQTSTNHNRIPWMTSLGGFMVSFLLVFTFPHFSLSWTLILFFYKGKIQQTNKNTMTCSPKIVHLDSSLLLWLHIWQSSLPRSPPYYVQIVHLRQQFLGRGVFLPLAFLQHVSVTRSLAWETHAVIDQLSNVMIKMKQPGNGGNLEERLTRIWSSSNQGDMVIFHRGSD